MKPDTQERIDAINNLNFLYRAYDRVNKTSASLQQMLLALNPECSPKHDPILGGEGANKGLTYLKGHISRRIEKELRAWPIWSEWLEGVPGVGAVLAAPLVIHYYYAFLPMCSECGGIYLKDGGFTCPDCGKTAKGEGLCSYKIVERDFPNVSKWWAYCGRHVKDGKMPKRAKGQQSNWSTTLRTTTFHIADMFVRQTDKTPYGRYLLERKAYREKTHPDATKGHRHNMAKNETAKLFLSHFWHVARTLEGKSTEGPYVHVVQGHTDYRAPFHWRETDEAAE